MTTEHAIRIAPFLIGRAAYWRAVCSCGWCGSIRRTENAAHLEWRKHDAST